MIFRITGAIFLLLVGLGMIGLPGIPQPLTGILGIIAGLALLIGA